MKIGIIGLGNMGRAFAKAFLKAGHQVVASTPHPEKEMELREFIEIYGDNRRVFEETEIVFIGVKPHQLEGLLEEIRPSLANHLIVSMALGKSIGWIKEVIGDMGVIRILPNTPVAIGKGVTAYAVSSEVGKERLRLFKDLMRPTGETVEILEDDFATFSAVAGSLPAFVGLVIEGLSDGAVLEGMKRSDSYKIIANTIIGSCQLMLDEGLHPGQLKDQVTSPGGSTIQGIKILEEGKIRHTFIKAIEETASKNNKMG